MIPPKMSFIITVSEIVYITHVHWSGFSNETGLVELIDRQLSQADTYYGNWLT
jgi:hypothetical protein